MTSSAVVPVEAAALEGAAELPIIAVITEEAATVGTVVGAGAAGFMTVGLAFALIGGAIVFGLLYILVIHPMNTENGVFGAPFSRFGHDD